MGLAGYAAPVADFSLSVTQGCVPLTVNFTDKSTGGVTSYSWDFGNGNKSTLKNPSAIYYASGKFSVKLTVTDGSGNKSTKTFGPVRVFSNPTVAFKADTVGCIGQALSFTDLSIKADTAITKWNWDFGDGNLGSGQNNTHAYTYSGKFTVGLSIQDGYGCKSLVAKPNYIRIKPTPVVDFTLDKTYSCALPAVVSATNKTTGATSYQWTCTDGSNSTARDFRMSFISYGTYYVTLTAVNGGCTNTLKKGPIVVDRITARFGIPNSGLCQGNSIAFTNNSNPQSGVTYQWSFGDGNNSSDKSPAHTYASPGTYTVKLTVSNGTCSDVATQQIKVYPRPIASISVTDSIGCGPPFRAMFRVNSADYSYSVWDFGDKSGARSFANGVPVDHQYNANGKFKVAVTVVNSYGCAADLKLTERVLIGTQSIQIDPKKVEGCVPKPVKYKLNKDGLKEALRSVQWTFSDSGSVYGSEMVNKLYSKAGVFTIRVKVETLSGCILTDSAQAFIGLHYYPTFFITKHDVCNNEVLQIVNTTPDSIKKKVRFEAIVTDPEDATIDNLYRIKTEVGGKHKIKLVAVHIGCRTESRLYDSVNVHGPFIKLNVVANNCKGTLVRIEPKVSWANKASLTKNDIDTLDYKQASIITANENMPVILRAWNDTFGCADTLFKGPGFDIHDPEITQSLRGICTPVTAVLGHNGHMKNYKWIFPNGDTSVGQRINYLFKNPGNYKVLLTGFFDSATCRDTFPVDLFIDGILIRDYASSSGICMPITLSLFDSTASNSTDRHIWTVWNDTIDVTRLKTTFQVKSLPGKDSVIRVKHIIMSSNGCNSEKEYNFPFGGPVGYTIYQRVTTCDTPTFHFRSFLDTSKTKFPVTYEWKMSSGLTSTAPSLSARFRTMGMNYFTLTIKDSKGCTNTLADSFEVSPNMLQPQFKADPAGSFCPPLHSQFADLSKSFGDGIVKWEWDFGDGTTSQLRNPEKLYLLPGKYDLTLKITSKSGCTATIKKPGYIIVLGPRGQFDFDRGDGCLPHTVEFRGITFDSATMEWDLGDGIVQQGNNFKHVYRQSGSYIPAMILSDSRGCKYTLPPIDTINVFDFPKAETRLTGKCFHNPIYVSQNAVSNHTDSMLKSTWFLNGIERSPGPDSFFMPEDRGMQMVRLVVENSGTCKDTADNGIRIYAPEAEFSPRSDFSCLGQLSSFINKTVSDTTVISYSWDFGDGNISDQKAPEHKYKNPGEYTVILVVKDVMDCYDTISRQKIAVVGDTMPPPVVPIRRASVLDDRQVELVFSRFPTFDFVRYMIYREANGKYYRMAEITDQNDTTFTDKQCNTLDASYCYKVATQNLCLYAPDIVMLREHCTIEAKAYGQMEANLINWSPYIGFDSIAQYQVWRQDYDKRGAYSLIDTVPGTQLHYVDTLITCFTRQNYKVKAIQKGGFREYSYSDTASAKPSYINATKPNYAWRTTVEDNAYTQVEWLNNAYSRNGIKGYLLTKTLADGTPIFNNRYFDALDTIYSDKAVKVNEKSYVYTVKGVDYCNDTTPASNVAQSILLTAYFDVSTQKPALSWNYYRVWDQKVSYYEIEQKQEDGSFVVVGKVSATESSFIDMNARPNCMPYYVYRVRAVSYVHPDFGRSAFSLSNEAGVRPYSTLFVPNAFSPDQNNINESFGPKGQYISKYRIEIFNRWGEKLFESNDCMAPWDGMYKSEVCPQEVYMYRIEAVGADARIYNLQGTFHLLR